MATIKRDKNGRIIFTKEMKQEYTILVPDMLPIHFNIMRHVFANAGYFNHNLCLIVETRSKVGDEEGSSWLYDA